MSLRRIRSPSGVGVPFPPIYGHPGNELPVVVESVYLGATKTVVGGQSMFLRHRQPDGALVGDYPVGGVMVTLGSWVVTWYRGASGVIIEPTATIPEGFAIGSIGAILMPGDTIEVDGLGAGSYGDMFLLVRGELDFET